MVDKQTEALRMVNVLFQKLTRLGWFDRIAEDIDPEEINAICDAVTEALAGAEKKPPGKTRSVEYFRCWMDNTWDTDSIAISVDTPNGQLDEAVREAAGKIAWSDEPPVFVGFHHEDQED